MPFSTELVARQQEIADLFYQNKLIPKLVNIRQQVWLWNPK
jgi:sulfonate transport system substrate-binding protein